MCDLHNSDSAGQSRFPLDSGVPPLGLDIQRLGWKLELEPSPELQRYMAGGKIPGGNLIIGKLTLEFDS